jgi:hypothetical protein
LLLLFFVYFKAISKAIAAIEEKHIVADRNRIVEVGFLGSNSGVSLVIIAHIAKKPIIDMTTKAAVFI